MLDSLTHKCPVSPLSQQHNHYQIIDSTEKLQTLIRQLQNSRIFALKCTCSRGRFELMSAMTVCLPDESIYIVDIKTLRRISDDLVSILQDNNIKKLMFDCRFAADCFHYQYKIKLSGIIDLQLIHYISLHPQRQPGEPVSSFLGTVQRTLGPDTRKELEDLKTYHRYSNWHKRPIPIDLILYDIKYTSLYFTVREKLQRCIPRDIDEISRKYAYRRTRFRQFNPDDPYWSNRFMPMNVLKEAKGGPIKCIKCDISLHYSQYDPFQLKNRKQECIVCRAVTKDLHDEKNRWYFNNSKKQYEGRKFHHQNRKTN